MTPKELAERDGKPVALMWIDAAMSALREYEIWLVGGPEPGARTLISAALATNFSLLSSVEREEQESFVARILDTFACCRDVLVRSSRFFVGVSEAAAKNLFASAADIPPAYAIFDEAIYFTPRFAPHDPTTGRGFGPLCRAAMVLHESVHVIDRESGEPEIHISEWDEPRFSAQTVEESVHNPSSYASFGAQVFTGKVEWPRSARYGAGRPAD